MKTIVIYHRSDFDGIFCREIAKHFLGETSDTHYIGWDYGDPVPEVGQEDNLYILDLSVDPLMSHPKLIWIDHHKSAIDKYPATIPGYRIDGVAACRLTWQWFYLHVERGTSLSCMPAKDEFVNRELIEPLAVRLAGEYDIWDKRDPDAELFQHGLRSRNLTTIWWAQMLRTDENDAILELLQSGLAIQHAKTQENEGIIKSYGFTLQWEGLTFLACNHARFNSLLFTAGLKPEHDACLGFNWDGKNQHWRFSLYHAPGREHHDLSQIAIKYGGGGHRGACGMALKTLPFTL
jgi:hypothetical protein